MFRQLEDNTANANVHSYLFGASTAKSTISNPEPKLLCWHNCKAGYYGWNIYESKWIIHAKDILKNSLSYEDNWKKINKNPYWYNYDKDAFYGYSATKPNGSAKTYAYGYKSNYHDNFDESLPVFT